MDLDNKGVNAVFDEFGTYDATKWRFFDYNNSFREFPVASQIQLGRGYWLIAKNEATVNTGGGNVPKVAADKPFEMELVKGWNLIGNPYNFKVSWQDVLDYNGNPISLDNLKGYNGGTWSTLSTLDPFKGAALFANEAISIKIPVLKNGSSGGRTDKTEEENYQNIDENIWSIPITVKQGTQENRLGRIGMHIEANSGFDNHDQVQVPLFEGMVGFHSLQNNEEFKLCADITGPSMFYVWDLNVQNAGNDEVINITWNQKLIQSSGSNLVLLDEKNGVLVDMLKNGIYNANSSLSSFKIIYGSPTEVETFVSGKLPMLGVPFPIPSTGKVSIPISIPGDTNSNSLKLSVYDSKGSKVEDIYNGVLLSGQHLIEWDLRKKGIYLIKMQLGSAYQTRKVIIN